MSTPIVTIVGRTNVGKSTLFNKIVGRKLSIVDDSDDVTRDGVFSYCSWNKKDFILIDTGGFKTEPKTSGILEQVNTKTKEYIEMSHSIIFVVNLKDGILPVDLEISSI